MAAKTKTRDDPAPVFVGGLGGSGTRVIMQILRETGCFIGTRLNKALDNLYFVVVTHQQPVRCKWPVERLRPYLDIFHRLNFGRSLSGSQLMLLGTSSVQNGLLRPIYGLVRHARRHKVDPASISTWISKNGTTQLYLKQLAAYYPGCKYVHVIRHGLDMAYSSNTNQLRLYGDQLGVASWESDVPDEVRQLSFWLRSNKMATQDARTVLPDNHLIVRYEDLCSSPAREIERLLKFLDLQPAKPIDRLADLVQPATIGRYKDHDLSVFPREDLKALERMGYEV